MFRVASYCSYPPFQTRGRNRLGIMPFISCGGGQGAITTIQTLPQTVASPARAAPCARRYFAKHGSKNSGKSMFTSARHIHGATQWTGPAIASGRILINIIA